MSETEKWLERLLVGDLDPQSEEARGFFREHPEARAKFEAMQQLELAIRGVGRERRDVVHEALEGSGPDLDVERFVTQRLDHPQPEASRPLTGAGRLYKLLPLAAAAAVALFLWGPWTSTDPGADGSPERGPVMGGELTLLAPISETHRIDELRWEYELEGSEYFKVFVYDPAAPFDPVATSPDLEESYWRPEHSDSDRWPDPFEWQVQVLVDGRLELEQTALVQRSP